MGFFSNLQHPGWVWDPPILPSGGYFEGVHSPVASAKVKNGGAMSISPHPYSSSWHSAQIIRNNENFT
jgi:hypothetical protein